MAILSGVQCRVIDCCVKSCCAFTGKFSELKECPYCKEARYNSFKKPRNTFKYIPLIPQLQALYGGEESARRMRFRSEHDHTAGGYTDIFDGKLYQQLLKKHVVVDGKELPHKFFEDPCDIALQIVTDGFQIFKKAKHTAWPLIFVNYNLPQDERCHLEDLVCVGVIPGPKAPKDIDSFSHPLYEELQELAVGVSTYDALEDEVFSMRAFAILGGGDIPAVSKAFTWMKGPGAYCACRLCSIKSVRSKPSTPGQHAPTTLYLPVKRPPGYPEPRELNARKLPLRTHKEFIRKMGPKIVKLQGIA